MKKQKGPSGAIGKGGVTPAPVDGNLIVRAAAERAVPVKWALSVRERELVRDLGRREP